MQSALDMSVSRRATSLSQSHTCTHFLMAPIEDRNGDEWSPSHQSNQKCIFHISVIELCTSCKLMRSSPLQLWQESTNNYLPIFPYVAINLNHWQATAAPPRTSPPSFLLHASAAATFSSAHPPPPSLFPRVPLSRLSFSLLECLLIKAERNWQPIDVREPVGRLRADMGERGNQDPTAVVRLRGFQVTVTWDFTCWHSSGTGSMREVPKGASGSRWRMRRPGRQWCCLSRDEGRWGK